MAGFVVMLGVRADGEHHVVAGGELLSLGVVGGRHLREPQVGVLVDQTHLGNRIGAERQNGGFACREVLRGLLVGDRGVLLRVVLVDLDQFLTDRRP